MNGINDLDLNDYIRYQIRTLSNRIHAIKESARKVIDTVKCYGYIDPQTSQPYPGYGTGCDAPPKEIRVEKKLFFDSYMKDRYDHIRPSLPQWHEYVQLKKDVSIWLATLHVSKGQDDKVKSHTQDLMAAKKRFERTFKMIQKFNGCSCDYEVRNVDELKKIQKEIKQYKKERENEKALRVSA